MFFIIFPFYFHQIFSRFSTLTSKDENPHQNTQLSVSTLETQENHFSISPIQKVAWKQPVRQGSSRSQYSSPFYIRKLATYWSPIKIQPIIYRLFWVAYRQKR